MNRIEDVKIKGNRVYVTVNVQGMSSFILRFYIEDSLNEFLANLTRAINYPNIESPLFGRKDGENEPFPHCDLVEGTMEILRNWGYFKYQLIGMNQKIQGPRYEYEVTGPGKLAYVLYMNEGVSDLDPMEVFLTYEDTVLRMLEWRNNGNFIDWRIKKSAPHIKQTDYMMNEWLFCIDNLEEILKFKRPHEKQIRFLRDMGLIKVRFFNE